MTDMNEYKAGIEEKIASVLKDNMFELVDLEITGPNYLSIRAEKPGALTSLDEYADLSRKIETALDAADIIPDRYFLEVSSPGIDRPLKKKEDFTRFAGKRVKVVTREKVNNTHDFTGMLIGLDGDNVALEENGARIEIAFDLIKKAKIYEEISFK